MKSTYDYENMQHAHVHYTYSYRGIKTQFNNRTGLK